MTSRKISPERQPDAIFVGSAFLNERELYLLGLLITPFFMVVFLPLGRARILLVT